ncbi:zinc finger CCCH domain-containing protein 37 isoform X2 [Hevea brasiliensis]|uniref:zinc finger CCCH domain-containing protein 37 isoform X2 n=1 Tax=Hevea brasiliensis TaxID=3981 RepID=UPI0025F00849|nr:zinc finger CCCH domain-containing protein 37 isoform X2 [Hevea brasiliensis]
MANKLYGYSSSYGAAPPSSAAAAGYTPRSVTDSYLPETVMGRYLGAFSDSDPSKYSVTSMYLTQSEALRYSADRGITSAAASASSHLAPWTPPPGVDVSAAVEPLIAGIKRSTEVLYHPTIFGAHNSIGQSEAWYSTNSLAKRSRFESASNLPIYPQRPGEKDCAHYMLTRTCKFGDSCKFDHPIWVPEGGIPNWKEVPLVATIESLPERLGQPDCPYFLKTQRCKYGSKCKFNHPNDKLATDGLENTDVSVLPERPSEPTCAFYMKTGKCKFGATCKFHHPKDIQILLGQENGNTWQTESAVNIDEIAGHVNVANASISLTPALFHNSKGLPIRPGEVDCPFYLKTGSCKYGATCRYNHPHRNAINPPAAAIGHSIVATPAANLNIGVVPAASIFQTLDPRLAHSTLGVGPTVYPQRPGQTECDYYMKTGECKFGERCRFHHPIDRSASTAKQAQEQTVKLTLAGLPRREGAVHCPYYMKTSTCKYGATCKFDHPPPGEVMTIAASHRTSTSTGVDVSGAEAGTP